MHMRFGRSGRVWVSDPAARWFAVLIAGVAATVLLLVAFAPWWGVGQSTITGWGAFGGAGEAVIVVVVVAGFLPFAVVALPLRLAYGASWVLCGIALGAALLIVWHLAARTVGFLAGADVTAAAPVAAASCLTIAAAAPLTAHGTGLWRDRIRGHVALLVLIRCGCVGLLVSLLLPWGRYGQAGEAGPRLSPITLTGWQASAGGAWCLLADAIAILVLTVSVRRGSRRATVAALAAAGWLAAAVVCVIPLRAIGVSALPFGIERSLTGHGPGFYIALGCAALSTILGVLLTASPVDDSP